MNQYGYGGGMGRGGPRRGIHMLDSQYTGENRFTQAKTVDHRGSGNWTQVLWKPPHPWEMAIDPVSHNAVYYNPETRVKTYVPPVEAPEPVVKEDGTFNIPMPDPVQEPDRYEAWKVVTGHIESGDKDTSSYSATSAPFVDIAGTLICTEFQRGNCRRGNNCRYEHLDDKGVLALEAAAKGIGAKGIRGRQGAPLQLGHDGRPLAIQQGGRKKEEPRRPFSAHAPLAIKAGAPSRRERSRSRSRSRSKSRGRKEKSRRRERSASSSDRKKKGSDRKKDRRSRSRSRDRKRKH